MCYAVKTTNKKEPMIFMIQQLRRGAGSLRHLPEMLEKLGIHKPMAVCAHSQLERLNDCLGTIPHAVFTGYPPQPGLSGLCHRA